MGPWYWFYLLTLEDKEVLYILHTKRCLSKKAIRAISINASCASCDDRWAKSIIVIFVNRLKMLLNIAACYKLY